jgi:hypothetical protein
VSDARGHPARGRRLAALAAELGVELPPFDGPLVAFDPGPAGPRTPVYLGGDLHAGARARAHRDPTLDAATVVIGSLHQGRSLELRAVEGIWCTRLAAEVADADACLALADSEGRLRAWRLLPPPRLMIGLRDFWLGSVPPPASSGPSDADPAA